MNKRIVTGIITVAVGLVLAATTWNFAATLNAVDSEEHRSVHERIDDKLDKIYDLIMEMHKEG